jgi:hypothetical protein
MMSLYLRQLEAFDRCRERSKPVEQFAYARLRENLESATAQFDELLMEFVTPRCDEKSGTL